MPKSSRKRALSADPRVFRFKIRCRRCNASFVTLQAARQHFVVDCPSVGDTAIHYGCCDRHHTSWPLCVAHLNKKGAHLRPPLDTITVSSSSDDGGSSPPVKVSPSASPPDSPVAGPSGVSAPTRDISAVVASASSTLVSPLSIPSLTPSDCDVIDQALGPSELTDSFKLELMTRPIPSGVADITWSHATCSHGCGKSPTPSLLTEPLWGMGRSCKIVLLLLMLLHPCNSWRASCCRTISYWRMITLIRDCDFVVFDCCYLVYNFFCLSLLYCLICPIILSVSFYCLFCLVLAVGSGRSTLRRHTVLFQSPGP